MKAMILAAGLGTRLRPLTNDRPKALVEIGGRTLLEITLARLREFGIREVIVNVHHFAEMIIDYLQANKNFGMRIEISREDLLLDTGGGLKHAAWFFLEDTGSEQTRRPDQPFVLHNVDVISTIDLARMLKVHAEHGSLATLAVKQRETSRYLLFDESLRLCGRCAGTDKGSQTVTPTQATHSWAFSGIHIISPRIFSRMSEEGAFSIIDCYLRLAAQGEKIQAFRADEYDWRDLGRPENVAQAGQDSKNSRM